jgi:conjugative transposon TraK protein
LAIVGFTFYKSQQTIAEIRKSVYVPVNGNSMTMMVSKNYTENRKVEIENHLRMFHDLFYNLSPDESQIKDKTTRAMYLGDKSIKNKVDELNENKTYSRLIGSNSFQYIQIDSFQVDQYSNPYKAIIYFKRYVSRPSAIFKYDMTTTCNLINVTSGRSENNPHALMIENWNIIKDVQIENRPRN